ncbi:hypothetical protein ACIQVK_21445 [Streptomyces sp. NPDC090493]|uniref:hypothetical protein n=1 Tax=Streptomyces sp. NPDC090493 TaxID=3365964 RepID=UPI003805473C
MTSRVGSHDFLFVADAFGFGVGVALGFDTGFAAAGELLGWLALVAAWLLGLACEDVACPPVAPQAVVSRMAEMDKTKRRTRPPKAVL